MMLTVCDPAPQRDITKDKVRNPKVITNFSEHNKRKLSILRLIMEDYKTAHQVAQETFSDGEDWDTHRTLVINALSRYYKYFTKPYVRVKKTRHKINGCRFKYKCTKKGIRVVKKLIQKESMGLPLKIRRPINITRRR